MLKPCVQAPLQQNPNPKAGGGLSCGLMWRRNQGATDVVKAARTDRLVGRVYEDRRSGPYGALQCLSERSTHMRHRRWRMCGVWCGGCAVVQGAEICGA